MLAQFKSLSKLPSQKKEVVSLISSSCVVVMPAGRKVNRQDLRGGYRLDARKNDEGLMQQAPVRLLVAQAWQSKSHHVFVMERLGMPNPEVSTALNYLITNFTASAGCLAISIWIRFRSSKNLPPYKSATPPLLATAANGFFII